MNLGTRIVALAMTVGALGCTTGGGAAPMPPPAPVETTPGVRQLDSTWPITTRLHIDLWLHGFAMIQDDTARVPRREPRARERAVPRAPVPPLGQHAARDRPLRPVRGRPPPRRRPAVAV